MKLWIKLLIGALTGFGGGFAAGFFTHKKINDVKFEEVTEEEMAEIEERAKAAKENAQSANDIPQEVPKKEPFDVTKVEALPEDPVELKKALQGKKPYIQADQEQKKAYEKLWNSVKEYSNEENASQVPVESDAIVDEMEDDEEETEEDIPIDPIPNEWDVKPPYVISLSDFYNDRPEYDKITIEWYEPDNTWLDEKEDIIPDIRSYIGTEVGSLFASNYPNEDPDVRFVRNERYMTDYEIIRHHRSWHETSGGMK